jgi:hypothetical protein
MKIRFLLPLLLLCATPALHAQEQIAMVRTDGLLVFLPDIGGRNTYGTFLVPDELGRNSTDRFVYLGNPLQINFLPPSELPRRFAQMDDRQKLEEFFRTESKHLTQAFKQQVDFTDLQPSRSSGVDYLAGTSTVTAPDGSKLKMRITARTAGAGILHAAYQESNRATLGRAQSLVDRLLRSFKLVNRPLTPDELTAISQKARD